MDRSLLTVLLVSLLVSAGNAFTSPICASNPDVCGRRSTAIHAKLSAEALASIGYTITVSKPLGVVFGENRSPFFGLVVDDVEPGQNGGKAGMRVGDQLLSVDGKPVVGIDFDSAMNALRNAADPIELDLYRGTISQLYTIMTNIGDDVASDDEEEEDDEYIIMDENYESPVQIDMSEYDKEQSISESASNIAKNLGKIFQSDKTEPDAKKKGLFGGMFSKETIQLDFDDGK